MTMLEPEIRPISAIWPPKAYTREQPPSFFTRVPEADRTVAWPPRGDSSRSSSSCSGDEPSQTVTLRNDVPIQQEQVPVYQAAPVVNAAPRSKGGVQWPPSSCDKNFSPTPPRVPTPKLNRKNPPGGFSNHALPNNYTGYRVAPGVLHMSPDASRYISDASTGF